MDFHTAANTLPVPTVSLRTQQGFGQQTMISVVLLAISLGLLVFTFMQKGNLDTLQTQFNDLTSKIDTTDASLNQSGAALSIRIQNQAENIKAQTDKLDTHFSEIDKLWAARNKLTKAMTDSKKSVDGVKKQLAAIDKKIASAIAAARASEAKVQESAIKLQKDIKAVGDELLAVKLGLDDLEIQTETSLNNTEALEARSQQWQKDADGRLLETEEAIQSIDSFRQHINTQISKLRASQGSAATGADVNSLRKRIDRLEQRQTPAL